MTDAEQAREEVAEFQKRIGALREEIGRVIVGNREVIDGVLSCMLGSSHALLEGVPGLGKTMLVRTLAGVLGLDFSRIQFTPDLMPRTSSVRSFWMKARGARARSSSGAARSSPTSCWRTKSIVPRPRPRARCSRPCRSIA